MNSGGASAGTGAGAAPPRRAAGAGEGRLGVAGAAGVAGTTGRRRVGTSGAGRPVDDESSRQHLSDRAGRRGRRVDVCRPRRRRASSRGRRFRFVASLERTRVCPDTDDEAAGARRSTGARCASSSEPTSCSRRSAIAAATIAARKTEQRATRPAASSRRPSAWDRPRGSRSSEAVAPGFRGAPPTSANRLAACADGASVPADPRRSSGTTKMFGRSTATASAKVSAGSAIVYPLRRELGGNWPRDCRRTGRARISCSPPRDASSTPATSPCDHQLEAATADVSASRPSGVSARLPVPAKRWRGRHTTAAPEPPAAFRATQQ